jgi:hypothetical protein
MLVPQKTQKEYEKLFLKIGEMRFFNYIYTNGLASKKYSEHPDNIILEQSECFFSLFRSTGNENFFIIGKVLRRVAHKLYRHYKKIYITYPVNVKFLQLIKQ